MDWEGGGFPPPSWKMSPSLRTKEPNLNRLRCLLVKLREGAPAPHGRDEHPLPDPSVVRERSGNDVVELAGLSPSSTNGVTADRIDATEGEGRR
jgi:hypothetical protein